MVASTSSLVVQRVGEVAGVEQVERAVDVVRLARAGQHHPVAALLERHDQLPGAGQQRRSRAISGSTSSHPALARLVADALLDVVPAERGHQLVAAHADQPVDPPDRERLPQRPERPVPGQGVLVVGVDEGPVDVEDGDARLSSCAALPSPGRPLLRRGVLEQAADRSRRPPGRGSPG